MAFAQNCNGDVDDDVKLLGVWTSPYVMRVQLALAAKGIAYTNVLQDLAPFIMRLDLLAKGTVPTSPELDPDTHKSPLLLQSNPIYKTVPVLLHNGKPVCDSLIICEYLDEAFPASPLLPTDPYSKAMARFWADFVDKKVLGTMLKMLRVPSADFGGVLEESKGYLHMLEEQMAKGEDGGPFFGGRKEIGYMDVVMGPLFVAFPVLESSLLVPTGFDKGDAWEMKKMPHLSSWLCAFKQSPLASFLPSNTSLVEVVHFIRKTIFPNE